MIKTSAPSRIINLSSLGHYSANLDFDDLMMEKGYDRMTAYHNSKLANILFTKELAKRLEGKTAKTKTDFYLFLILIDDRHTIGFSKIL